MPNRLFATALALPLLLGMTSPPASAEPSDDIEARMQQLMSYDMREYMAEHGALLPSGQHINGELARELTRGGTFMLQMRFGQDDTPEIHLIRTNREKPQPIRDGQDAFARFTSAELSVEKPSPIAPIQSINPHQKPVPPRPPEPSTQQPSPIHGASDQ